MRRQTVSVSRHTVLPILLLAAWGPVRADDWPQWRGPQRDGVWRESGIVESFASPELQPVWTAPIGAGYSGPTVAGDQVFVADRVTAPEQQERVVCLDRKTGAKIWIVAYPCVYRDLDYALGPRAAVTVADGRAFSLGAMGHAHGIEVETGKVLWSRDLAGELQADIPLWGITSAPLVFGDTVIFQIGGRPDACLVALDLKTGKERWRALDGPASYSAPRLIRQGDKDVVLAWTGHWLACLNPATGAVFWKEPFKPNKMVIHVPDPVLDESGSRVFLTSFYDGSFLLQLKPDLTNPDVLWQRKGVSERQTDALHSMIVTPLIRGGHVYGIDSYGEMRCLDLATGDRVWSDQSLLPNGRWATAYFVQNGDRTWMTTEQGEVVIAKLTPVGFERISSAHFLTPTTDLRGRRYRIAWSHPAYAHRHLFARNDRELVCVSLEAKP